MTLRYLTPRDIAHMTPAQMRRRTENQRRIVRALETDHRNRYPDALKPYCEVMGCILHTRAQGMCDTHYRQELRATREAKAA